MALAWMGCENVLNISRKNNLDHLFGVFGNFDGSAGFLSYRFRQILTN